MLLGPPCPRCREPRGAFQAHFCHRPELGPRIPGPGFAMRWVRRPYYVDPMDHWPTYIESQSPLKEATRAYRPIEHLARELVEHDRRITGHPRGRP